MNKKLFIGRDIIKVDEIDSTNSYLDRLSDKKPIEDGTVLSAKHQLNGKGQANNNWESNNGENLLLSIYLKPFFLAVTENFYLNICTSLAIADYLVSKKMPNIYIKWPNDILVNNKKISGILIKNQIRSNVFSNSIIGIGININQLQFITTKKATSLSIEKNKTYNLNNELNEFLYFFENRYLSLKKRELSIAKKEYIENLYPISKFRIKDKTFSGKIIGISPQGKLLVEKRKKVKKYEFGEIHLEY